ncbi:lipid II flippase MurJ, partial [Escherichia coli]|nr:lipid II flippase MurJ [Escherichia coli]
MAPIRLVSGFVTVGVWTLASRVLGFVRDILIAAYFNMAFVPMFSKKLEADEDPLGFARDALSGLAAVLVVFTLIAQIFMPWLVLAMASGFAADDRLALATHYGRIAFPYILFISLAALLSGVLNSLG